MGEYINASLDSHKKLAKEFIRKVLYGIGQSHCSVKCAVTTDIVLYNLMLFRKCKVLL